VLNYDSTTGEITTSSSADMQVNSLITDTIESTGVGALSSLFANSTSKNINIGTGLTTGLITLGTATGDVSIPGTAITNTIESSATNSTVTCYNNLTTGSIKFAETTSGNITIGSASSTTASIEGATMNMTGDTLVDIRSTDHIKIGYNSGVVCASTEIHGASVDIAGTTEIAGQLTATYYTVCDEIFDRWSLEVRHLQSIVVRHLQSIVVRNIEVRHLRNKRCVKCKFSNIHFHMISWFFRVIFNSWLT
jgi:hypothetical protein